MSIFISAASLPGADFTGLPFRSANSGTDFICIGYRPRVTAWYGVRPMNDKMQIDDMLWHPMLHIDMLFDVERAQIRDFLARYIEARLPFAAAHSGKLMPSLATAPLWEYAHYCTLRKVWRLSVSTPAGPGDIWFHPEDASWDSLKGREMNVSTPGLEGVDADSYERLPDGSSRADAIALMLAAQAIVPHVQAFGTGR